ncbi:MULTISPECIES: hypothetical protein [Paenibacillus]|uniref:hypothetical protein n=1 Tax=Paenibacillus TaxID=44249 RepID=UPI00211B3F4D|nr:hypothetical protein [Paenibacillus amylolyticus]
MTESSRYIEPTKTGPETEHWDFVMFVRATQRRSWPFQIMYPTWKGLDGELPPLKILDYCP